MNENLNGKKPAVPNKPTGASSAKVKKKKLSPMMIVIIIITAVLVIGIAVFGFLIVRKYARIQNQQNDLQGLYPGATVSALSSDTTSGGNEDMEQIMPETPESEPIGEQGILPSFEELHKLNQDVIGYAEIPGTKLSTPIVQGTDNVYYLNHDYYQKKALGIPFVDCNAEITPEKQSTNLTIYGHAAKDGSYFAPIKKFTTVDYYKKYPLMTFDTIYGKGTYKIIGVFIAKVKNDDSQTADPEWFNYHNYIDMTNDEFNTYISEVKKRSFFNTGVDVMYGDKLVTLSTCDDTIIDSEQTPYRMVLVARKVRAGESTQVDVSKASANSEMIMPKEWQEKNGKVNPYK